MMKWTELLLLPLHLFVCCLLHLIFASYRFSIVIAHLSPFLPFFSAATIPSSSLSQPEQQDDVNFDRSRWLKTPKHVGIIFVPSSNPSSFFSPSSWFYRRGVTQHEGRELQVLAKLIKDVRALLEWCEKLGVESVSFYDEEGILERNFELVSAAITISTTKLSLCSTLGRTSFNLSQSALVVSKGGVEGESRESIDSGCGASDVEASDSSTSTSVTLVSTPTLIASRLEMRVNLLSRLSGRPHLALVARELATFVQDGRIRAKDIDAGFIHDSIEASGIADPDLLIVLGGPYLRLRGFPPWQLRLTEMYHHSSPSWLPEIPLTYAIFRAALDVYGGAEMRLGR